jgi:UDP-3-O-[3-hydroxymyristoyl] glucosamine N-acyltransferase
MQRQFELEEIAKITGAKTIEGTSIPITGIASLGEARSGDLSFLGNRKYHPLVADSKASIILLPSSYEGRPQAGQAYLRVDNPSFALAEVCRVFEAFLWPRPVPEIHPSAFVDEAANVCSTAYVGPHAFVGAGACVGRHVVVGAQAHVGCHAKIGENTHLMPRATVLDYCIIGERVRIHSGAVIGADGFGYDTVDGVHHKQPQIGNVVIEDDVEIGSNTVVDRARFSSTYIGRGTKIDNLVQIAHNVQIGKHCILVSQVGIAGSTILEDCVVLGGQVGIAGHLRIGKGAQIGAQSGLSRNVEAGSIMRGTPASPFNLAQRMEVLKRRLPELFERVKHLEEHLSDDKP